MRARRPSTTSAYDDLYRLEGEEYQAPVGGGTSVGTSLSYDAVGNILTAYGDGDKPLPARPYTYDAANRLIQVRYNGGTV